MTSYLDSTEELSEDLKSQKDDLELALDNIEELETYIALAMETEIQINGEDVPRSMRMERLTQHMEVIYDELTQWLAEVTNSINALTNKGDE